MASHSGGSWRRRAGAPLMGFIDGSIGATKQINPTVSLKLHQVRLGSGLAALA